VYAKNKLYRLCENLKNAENYDGSKVEIQTMHQTNSFRYADMGDYESIELPYGKYNVDGQPASMFVMLPKEGLKLTDFEKSFSYEKWVDFQTRFSQIQPARGAVSIPKFKFKYSRELKDLLMDLGMYLVFSPGADFTNMTIDSVAVSRAFQKTFVSVDEDGTEAAAVTGIVVARTCIPRVAFNMNINRPFMFLIQDNETGTVLFMGSVEKPEAGE